MPWYDHLVIDIRHSWYYQVWQIATMIVAIYSSCMYAYFACFRKDVDYQTYEEYSATVLAQDQHRMFYFTLEKLSLYNKLNISFEAVFLCETLLNFFLKPQTFEDEHTVHSLKKIAIKHFYRQFLFDAVLLLPFNIILSFEGSRYFFAIKSLRLIHAFEILDIKKFFGQIIIIKKK